MRTRKTILLLVLASCAVAVPFLWGQITTQEARKISVALRPYETLSVRTSSNNIEVLYVLDVESKLLAVLKYDSANKVLAAIGGRDLAKDFGGDDSGGYSMTYSVQTASTPYLLYVTDHGSKRAIVYEIDPFNNKITPQQPIDLGKVFGAP